MLYQVDYPALLQKVDETYCDWRKPALLIFGGADPFINLGSVFEFLESKRTCMRFATMTAKASSPCDDLNLEDVCTKIANNNFFTTAC